MLRRKMLRTVAICSLVVVLASACAVLQVHAAVDNFTLFGSASSGWGFTMSSISSPGPAITVVQGDIVNLTLTSADGQTHRFFVDYNGNGIPDPGEPASALFNATTGVQFNTTVAGTFRYYCAFHPSIMYGTLTVKGGGSQPPTTVNFGLLPLLLIGGAVAIGAALFMILGSAKSTHYRHQKKIVSSLCSRVT